MLLFLYISLSSLGKFPFVSCIFYLVTWSIVSNVSFDHKAANLLKNVNLIKNYKLDGICKRLFHKKMCMIFLYLYLVVCTFYFKYDGFGIPYATNARLNSIYARHNAIDKFTPQHTKTNLYSNQDLFRIGNIEQSRVQLITNSQNPCEELVVVAAPCRGFDEYQRNADCNVNLASI